MARRTSLLFGGTWCIAVLLSACGAGLEPPPAADGQDRSMLQVVPIGDGGVCGDGFCDDMAGESCSNCPTDCGSCAPASTCDGTPGQWAGCRGNGCAVCQEQLAGYDCYFQNHPRCALNTTCAGQFFTCNADCPQPTEADRCGTQTPYQCHEPNGSVPLPLLEHYHVRIDPDSLYVCDTLLGWEAHFPWPQLSWDQINEECVGACGSGCSGNTCTRTGSGDYVDLGDGEACRDTHYDCYAADCCWYHDLCGRMFPTAVFTDPFCHALGIVYGCAACLGSGFPGCAFGPSYTVGFDHPYTDREDCVCSDRPGDCVDDCSGACWAGCDDNSDCFDDCTGEDLCGDPFCPDFCNGFCGGFGFCAFGFGAPRDAPRVVSSDLQVQVGGQTLTWRADELAAMARPLASVAALAAPEQDGLGARPGWSLRELVRRKLGDAARVTALVSQDGKRVGLDAAAWGDAGATPILRVNHQGQLRFHWVGGQGRKAGLKDVRTIEVVVPAGGGQPGGQSR
jgi:hypothetical protein